MQWIWLDIASIFCIYFTRFGGKLEDGKSTVRFPQQTALNYITVKTETNLPGMDTMVDWAIRRNQFENSYR